MYLYILDRTSVLYLLAIILGGGVTGYAQAGRNIDYRLYSFLRIEIRSWGWGYYFGKKIFLFFVFYLFWTTHYLNPFQNRENDYSLNPFHISEHDYSLFTGKIKMANSFNHLPFFLLGVSIIDPSCEVMPDKTRPIESSSQIYTFINQFVWKKPTGPHTHNLIFTSLQSRVNHCPNHRPTILALYVQELFDGRIYYNTLSINP